MGKFKTLGCDPIKFFHNIETTELCEEQLILNLDLWDKRNTRECNLIARLGFCEIY